MHVRLETEIEKLPYLIGLCHRVAAEDVVFQDTGEGPGCAAVGRVTPAALPEVGGNVVELSPGDCHLVAVCGVNRDRALVRGVADDILAIRIDVDLETGERTELRDHSRRSLYLPRGAGGLSYFSSGSFRGTLRVGASWPKRWRAK